MKYRYETGVATENNFIRHIDSTFEEGKTFQSDFYFTGGNCQTKFSHTQLF